MHYTFKLTIPRNIHKGNWRWKIEINEKWRKSLANWPCQIECQGAKKIVCSCMFYSPCLTLFEIFKKNLNLRIWIGRKKIALNTKMWTDPTPYEPVILRKILLKNKLIRAVTKMTRIQCYCFQEKVHIFVLMCMNTCDIFYQCAAHYRY